MATTKFSVSAYTADGVTTDFLITWDYLDEDHIAVYVDGVANYDPSSTYKFQLINSTTVRVTDEFNNAVPSGLEIQIRRETPITTRVVTFVDGSSFLAEDMNKNSDYLLYSMQETQDFVDETVRDGALQIQTATGLIRDEAAVFRDQTLVYRDEAESFKNSASQSLATLQNDINTIAAAAQADADKAELERIAAAQEAVAAEVSKTEAQVFRDQAQTILEAAKIPTNLANKAKQFLQVKNDETGYILVSSVAAPSFYGFNMSANGEEIVLTYGRDDDYKVDDFATWTMSENINFAIQNNSLVVVL